MQSKIGKMWPVSISVLSRISIVISVGEILRGVVGYIGKISEKYHGRDIAVHGSKARAVVALLLVMHAAVEVLTFAIKRILPRLPPLLRKHQRVLEFLITRNADTSARLGPSLKI